MWKETSREVYAVIWARHQNDLAPFSSYTDSTGEGNYFSNGKPEIITEWGFRNSETPLIKIVQTKQDKDQKEWDSEFFIYYNNEED